MREIKFRAWDKEEKRFWIPEGSQPCSIEGAILDFSGGDGFLEWSQYTGLKDKNGKEIFEGDVVRAIGVFYVVEWNKKSLGFQFRPISKGREKMEIINLFEGDPVKLEIIGNIYENPELLAEKK